MADTRNITLKEEDGWTLITPAGSGLITAGSRVEYVQSTNTPDESLFGHWLTTFEPLRYDSQNPVYMRGNAIIAITED